MNIKRILKKLFFIFLFVITLFGYLYIKTSFLLPNNIMLIKGSESIIELNAPINVGMTADREGIIKVNGNEIVDNFNVNLKKPIKFESSDIGNVNLKLKLFGKIPIRNVTVSVMPESNVIPCGKTIGVIIHTKGILVVGTSVLEGEDSKEYKPYKDANIKEGDIILSANDKEINNISDFSDIVLNSKGKKIELKISRDSSIATTSITPVKCVNDKNYRVGLWVRDSTSGIGTMTFYDPESNYYAALGHGIVDIDTNSLLTVNKGEILESNIVSIIKGRKGIPGELKGTFSEKDVKGNILYNTNFGIYGNITDAANLSDNEAIPIALRNEVEEGPAIILSNIDGGKVESYDIVIQKVIKNNYNTSKCMVIKVTDQNLIDSTGGIVQGMSGSPIIQNGKLVGAVTHVFVNDATRGYGIFAELMFQNLKK